MSPGEQPVRESITRFEHSTSEIQDSGTVEGMLAEAGAQARAQGEQVYAETLTARNLVLYTALRDLYEAARCAGQEDTWYSLPTFARRQAGEALQGGPLGLGRAE